jgi:hypothetical protein
MNVTVNASGSREKARATPTAAAPKQESHSAAIAVTPDGDDEIADAMPLATISTAASKSLCRYVSLLV